MIAIDGAQPSMKSYIISNGLPDINDPIKQNMDSENYPEDVNRILLLLILSHIFMSNNAVGEGLLFAVFFITYTTLVLI